MNSRRSLAIIVGTLGVYLLLNAAFAGYGLYLAHEVLNSSIQGGSSEVADLREQYSTVVVAFIIFSAFGSLAIASGFGLARNAPWSQFLWLGTSVAIVLCILYAVIAMGASLLSHYLFVLAVIGISWWYLAAQRKMVCDEA